MEDTPNKIYKTENDNDQKINFLDNSSFKIQKDNTKPTGKRFLNLYGIFFALLNALSSSLMNVFTKKANFFSGTDVATFRYTIQLIAMIIIGCCLKINLLGPKEIRISLLLIGILNTLCVMLIFLSLKLINPSESSALFSVNMAIIPIIARFYLKEKISIINLFALMFSMLGVVFISQPSFLFNVNFNSISPISNSSQLNNSSYSSMNETEKLNRTLGISSGILSALLAAIAAIFMKKIANKKVHYSLPVIYQSYLGIPFSFLSLLVLILTGVQNNDMKLIENPWKTFNQLVFVIFAGLFGSLVQLFFNLALKYEETTKVSMIASTSLLFTFLFQYLILNIESNLWSTIGALLIFSAVFLIILFRILEKRASIKKVNQNNQSVLCWKKIIFFKF